MEIFLRVLELLLEVSDAFPGNLRQVRLVIHVFPGLDLLLLNADQKTGAIRIGYRFYHQIQLWTAVGAHAAVRDRRARLLRSLQRRIERQLQFWADQIQHVQGWLSVPVSQVLATAGEGVNHLQVTIDEEARRRVLADQSLLGALYPRFLRWRFGAPRRRGAHRWCRQVQARGKRRVSPLAVYLPMSIQRFKARLQLPGRLAWAQEQHATGLEPKEHDRQRSLLSVGVQVNEQVATRDQVEFRKRRVVEHIVGCKNHHVSQFTDHLKLIADFSEVASHPFRIEPSNTIHRVSTCGGLLQRRSMRISGEYLYAQ